MTRPCKTTYLLLASIAATVAGQLSPMHALAAVDEVTLRDTANSGLAIGDADHDGDIDLDDLVARIGDSKAIGFLTKLSLKRDIDGFERDLKTFHGGKSSATLAELHERYDLLVHKLLALLQEKDSDLANDISSARDYLWSKLADAEEFNRM